MSRPRSRTRRESRQTSIDFCWKTAGRWEDLVRLQHPEGVHSSPGTPTQGWKIKPAATIDGIIFG